MNRIVSTLAAAAVLTPAVLSQVTIPPHSSIYNGFSRGYNFTAATNFIISQLDLPPDAFQAGDTASYMVRVNGVEVLRSVGNAGAINTNILVNNGDVVDVIGNWSPATTGNFTAHNSCGSSAPFATTILGVAHTLNRTGWQWDIGDPAYTSGAYLAPTTGSMGRVLMWATPQQGLFPEFSATPTSGNDPLNVQFTDQSFSSATPNNQPIAWLWDFDNDGNVDSPLQNPSHTYQTEGIYDVSLTVIDGTPNSPATLVKTGYIEVGTVHAGFTFNVVSAAANAVQFTDTSTGGPTSWAWDFQSDGTIDSTSQNPGFAYPGPGTYSVTLTVADAISTDTVTVEIGIGIVPIPGFGSTFTSATLTRGFWFTTPVPFSIVSLSVPDESGHGLQNVAVYRPDAPVPSYATTAQTDPLFTDFGSPSGAPIPCVISFDAGDHVGILGACGDATTMRNSYATPAGVYASSIFGQPTTLTRFGTQNNIVATGGFNDYWQEPAGALSRINVGISSAAGIQYGDRSAATPGTPAPSMRCTALPILGQNLELTIENPDANAVGVVNYGIGRANLVSPVGTWNIGILIVGVPLNGGAPMPAGTYRHQIAVPNDPALIGARGLVTQNVNIVPGSQLGTSGSEGVELVFSN